MNISLQNNDIQTAIANYVKTMGIVTDGKEVTVAFRVGRKGSGVTAAVSINEPGFTNVADVAAKKANGKPKDAKVSVTPVLTQDTAVQVDTTAGQEAGSTSPEPTVSGVEVTQDRVAEVRAEAEPENGVVPPADAVTDAEAPKSTTSLFN